ncbi:chondroitin AC/alginate lyase [Mycena filopes]|nr:chondroitin AC/alginate lyase [Mycena filopes]
MPRLLLLLAFASSTLAIDWTNSGYAIQFAKQDRTKDAQNAIMKSAASSAKQGPWSVTNSKNIMPPNRDPHCYYSFAPYHWPECDWCTTKGGSSMHLVHNKTQDGGSSSDDSSDPDNQEDDNDDENYQDEAVSLEDASEVPVLNNLGWSSRKGAAESVAGIDIPSPQAPLNMSTPNSIPFFPTTTTDAVAGTASHPQAAAKTTSKTSSCTPSPTKSLAPTATWTTCPYAVHDGKVNPDVRTLNGPSAINGVSQSCILNAMAIPMSDTPSSFCESVVKSITTFFLNPATRMSPNMKFGQVVRGPDTYEEGTFTGILDLRGIVYVVNAMRIMHATGNPCWTIQKAADMASWMGNYSNWLTTSSLGNSTESKANNHATFFYAQLAVTRLAMGDEAEALHAVQKYFSGQFLDQIACNGEQPFESVRTRPFHYRCFNLEAMVTLAKIGDELGLNCWTIKSKFGATIQTAVDYAMTVNPKGEDVTELGPHVAAIAAAYGDTKGKYVSFLKDKTPDYRQQMWWHSNQPEALKQAPVHQKGKREDAGDAQTGVAAVPFKFDCVGLLGKYMGADQRIQLDNNIWATCGDLEGPFMYGSTVTPLVAER